MREKLKIFLLIFCFIFLFLHYLIDFSYSKIRLSEIVACNHTILYDEMGIFHDYIELYNSSSQPIDISDYHLSDTKKNLSKFTFPKNTIVPAKTYFLIWAEQKTATDAHKSLYTGFRIKSGEKIYFSDKNGKIIDKIKVPKDLACNMSYSRLPYIDKWAKREATPGKLNKLYNTKKVKVLPDIKVEFSKPSGFYEKLFKLKMSAPEGFDIYYTLDSTRPNEKSLKYTLPIEIYDRSGTPNIYSSQKNLSRIWSKIPCHLVDKATIVRAIAVRKSDGAVSEISDASYFVGFQNKPAYKNISVISIITDPENLFDYEKGIYVTGKIYDMTGNDSSLPCYLPTTNYSAEGKDWAREISVFYKKGSKSINLTGKMKIQGKCTRDRIQKNLTLFDLKEEGKASAPDFEFDLRAIGEIRRINESMVYDLTSDRSELLSHPSKDIISLFLDGEFWGTYFVYERMTPQFILEKTGLKDPSLIDMLRNNKMYGKTDLKEEYKTYDEVKQQIDIDSLISFVAINAYISNTDTCNLLWWNLVRWKSREDPVYNKWHWMLYDLDNNNLFIGQDPFYEQETCNLIIGNSFSANLFSFEDFRKKFIITFQDIANYNFSEKRVNHFLDDFLNKYTSNMVINTRRFFPYDYFEKDFINQMDGIRFFYTERFHIVMPYLKKFFGLKGDLVPIHKIPSTVNGGKIFLNTLQLAANEEYTGKYYSDYDISLHVETLSDYIFQGWLIDGELTKEQNLNLKLDQPHKIQAVWIEKEKKNE